jgi:hypothetical protein
MMISESAKVTNAKAASLASIHKYLFEVTLIPFEIINLKVFQTVALAKLLRKYFFIF